MYLVSIFVVKDQFGHSNFFISIWSLFWKIWYNQVLSISGTVTTLNGVPRVSSWIFWIYLFISWFFWIIYLF